MKMVSTPQGFPKDYRCNMNEYCFFGKKKGREKRKKQVRDKNTFLWKTKKNKKLKTKKLKKKTLKRKNTEKYKKENKNHP